MVRGRRILWQRSIGGIWPLLLRGAALSPCLAGSVAAQTPGSVSAPVAPGAPGLITGVIRHEGRPVTSATITVSDSTGYRARANSGLTGAFRVKLRDPGRYTVAVRALGFRPSEQQITAGDGMVNSLDISLIATATTLSSVVTTATLRETFVSESPVKVDVVTTEFLKRNVSNNVMDNISFLPGLNQQVDCGVCFTNNIRINGMDGPYTAVLIDGTPMMSALATVYGLNSIDPSLIEQIEIIKGPNSTLYGSEAMGGVINIVTKDARLAPRLSVNAFATSNGETNVGLGAARTLGRAQTLFSLNGAWNDRFVDNNDDGFRDLPAVTRLSVLNKWAIGTAANRPFDLSARYYYEDRTGGVAAFRPTIRGSSSIYGESIRTNRAEVLSTWRAGPLTAPFRLDMSLNFHHQNSFYGDQAYVATQTVAFAQGVWSPQVGSHAMLFGATVRQQKYRDSTTAQRTSDSRFIPGVFAQDEFHLGETITLLGGLRVDHHRVHGVIPSPRLALKWAPAHGTVVRVNAATGFRVVSLFTEDHAALTGARQVRIAESLNPERSRTLTASVNQSFDVGGVHDAMTLDVDAFLTRFSNRIVGDFDSDPNLIIYANLRGYAETRGVSVALGYATQQMPLFANLGVTVQDAFLEDRGVRRGLVFAPRVQSVFTVGYRFDRLGGLTLDWTGRVQGPTPLPAFSGLASRSTWFTEQHVQGTLPLGHGPTVFVAIKNVFNYVQRDAIIDPGNPFGDAFDTARVYGPLQGRRVLLGLRQTVGR